MKRSAGVDGIRKNRLQERSHAAARADQCESLCERRQQTRNHLGCEADFESGIGQFVIFSRRPSWQKCQKPIGKIRSTIISTDDLSRHARSTAAADGYVDASAGPGEKHSYAALTVNSVGLKSKPSAEATTVK
jgi:hypothetical protein